MSRKVQEESTERAGAACSASFSGSSLSGVVRCHVMHLCTQQRRPPHTHFAACPSTLQAPRNHSHSHSSTCPSHCKSHAHSTHMSSRLMVQPESRWYHRGKIS